MGENFAFVLVTKRSNLEHQEVSIQKKTLSPRVLRGKGKGLDYRKEWGYRVKYKTRRNGIRKIPQ